MPYNPGIQDISGQLLASGIYSGAHSLSGSLDRLTEQMDKKKEEDKFKLGLVKAMAPKFADLGYMSKEEMLNDSSDTILGRVRGHIYNEESSARKLQTADLVQRMSDRDIAASHQGDLGNAATLMGQMLGGNQSLRALPNQQQSDIYEGNIPPPPGYGGNQATMPQALAEAMAQHGPAFASPQSDNLMNALSRMEHLTPPGGAAPIVDTVELPYGHKGAILRGSKNLQILSDPAAAGQTEDVTDAAGNVHTIVRNPKSGAATILHPPTDNGAQQAHLHAQTLVDLEKMLQGIDEQLRIYGLNDQRVEAGEKNPITGKAYTKLAAGPRKELETRRAKLIKLYESTGEPSATSGPTTAPAAAPDKIVVEKDGKQFRLPKGQLADAIQQGYKLVP